MRVEPLPSKPRLVSPLQWPLINILYPGKSELFQQPPNERFDLCDSEFRPKVLREISSPCMSEVQQMNVGFFSEVGVSIVSTAESSFTASPRDFFRLSFNLNNQQGRVFIAGTE